MDPSTEAHRLSCPTACGILVPQPGIEPESPALEAKLSFIFEFHSFLCFSSDSLSCISSMDITLWKKYVVPCVITEVLFDKQHSVFFFFSLFFLLADSYTLLTEKAMAPHSSTLAWKIPWTEEPARLQSMGSLRVGHDCATSLSLFTFMHWRRKWQPTPVFLSGESQGQGSLVGCRLWGRIELNMTEVT